jgi:hypothetical protein
MATRSFGGLGRPIVIVLAALAAALLAWQCSSKGVACATAEDCRNSEVCVAHVCRASCLGHRDCPADALCLRGACLPLVMTCTSSASCPEEWLCHNGVCGQPCNDSADCPLAVLACEDGVCALNPNPDCASTADCNVIDPCADRDAVQCLGGVCVAPNLPEHTPCDDRNPCTTETSCDDLGECVNGYLLPCQAPPASHCVDDDTFVSYVDVGTCRATDGQCEYAFDEFACPSCASTCEPRCAAILCDDDQGGCRLNGICVPDDPAYCRYDEAAAGTPCDLPGAPPHSLHGRCDTGVCRECLVAADCNWPPAGPRNCFAADCEATTCVYTPLPTVVCGDPTCADGAARPAPLCGPEGSCPEPLATSCAGYACDQESARCRESCGNDGDCIQPYTCRLGECTTETPLKGLGEACTLPGECASGFCTDGVCCIIDCTGACRSCDAAGQCLNATPGAQPAGCDVCHECVDRGACGNVAGGQARPGCNDPGEACSSGQCHCTPNCAGRECDLDPYCGQSCGTCISPEACDTAGRCTCTPDCSRRECGPDPSGCGTSCGNCTPPEICDGGGQCACTPDCTGRECGPDLTGCGTSCGSCGQYQQCNAAGRCDTTTCDIVVSPGTGNRKTLFTTTSSSNAPSCRFQIDGGAIGPSVACNAGPARFGYELGATGWHTFTMYADGGPGGDRGCAFGFFVEESTWCTITVAPGAGHMMTDFAATLQSNAGACNWTWNGTSRGPTACNQVLPFKGYFVSDAGFAPGAQTWQVTATGPGSPSVDTCSAGFTVASSTWCETKVCRTDQPLCVVGDLATGEAMTTYAVTSRGNGTSCTGIFGGFPSATVPCAGAGPTVPGYLADASLGGPGFGSQAWTVTANGPGSPNQASCTDMFVINDSAWCIFNITPPTGTGATTVVFGTQSNGDAGADVCSISWTNPDATTGSYPLPSCGYLQTPFPGSSIQVGVTHYVYHVVRTGFAPVTCAATFTRSP